MKTIALTGSFGSGKSAVLKFVSKLGFPTIDSDRIVAGLYRNKGVQAKLKKIFGTADRRKISEVAFSSPAKRKKLESILHPLVWREVKAKVAKQKSLGKALVFVDVPLLFEVKWQNRFDATVFVKAPKKKCIARLKERGFSKKEALQRWRAQMPQKKKVKLAHYLIDNGSSLSKTEKQVQALIEKLRRME
jgi:dephospho-CoA kinase